MKNIPACILSMFIIASVAAQPKQAAAWEQQAKRVTIIRDKWGIPHIYGKTDADCVFGLMYAQCEDDFKRVERNYIDVLGRTAEVDGISSLYDDLYTRLVIDSAAAIQDFKTAAPWLRKLLIAYADGMNYYLFKNPSVKPALLTRFEPWYPLMWTDGSISAIQTGDVTPLEVKSFYTGEPVSARPKQYEEIHTGSNGFALAPSRTESGKSILYINPHVTFYFRPEVHVVSEEGLNAYGAVTWGQFFVYQGFNQRCGWMHTSGYSDVADMYSEEVTAKGNGFQYQYKSTSRPVKEKLLTLRYKDGDAISSKKIRTFSTHHGPVMAKRNGKWISIRAQNRSMNALIQSWQRTKATSFAGFKKNMELLSNASNNTVYADADGNIAYWHGNFIPKRDTAFDWTKPVPGTTDSTEWKGLHKVDESIHLYNPASGWIQNCNSTPFTSSGESSPKKEDYPFYMATEPENFRGINASRIFSGSGGYTIDKVIAAGYDTYLSAFEKLVPALVKAFLDSKDTAYSGLSPIVQDLAKWDMKTAANSVATAYAIEWAQRLRPVIARVAVENRYEGFVEQTEKFAATATEKQLLEPLLLVMNDFLSRHKKWDVQWGEINRYQRLTGNLREIYDDAKPSIPSGFAASTWGCLPSFVSRYFENTNKRYGYNGNSFVCAVEFGTKIKAKSLLAGGQSSHPGSPHFGDQAEMYTKGVFKEVLFYKEDVLKNAERSYHPGQ